MDILNNKSKDGISKPEIEQVEQKKQEYYLLGTYILTRGLRVFQYNYLTDKTYEVIIKYGNTIHLVPTDDKLIPVDYELKKCVVDNRFPYFEALNITNAIKRVKKYKYGKIDNLCNLRIPNPEGINFFK